MLSEVPEGWSELPFGELTSIVGGTTPKKNVEEYWDSEDVLWATPTDITSLSEGSYFLSDTATKASVRAVERGGLKLLPANTVLMTSRATIGYVAIAKREISTNQGFANFLPSEKYTPLFLLYLLQSKKEHFMSSAGGSTFKEISKGVLKSLTALLPPLNEQHRIAEILSSLDASIQATQAVIEQAERVKRGLMEELFTGGLGSEAIERGEVPEGWALSPVSSVLKPSLFIDGDWVESKDQSPDGDVRLIQLADIGDGYFIDKSDRHLTKDTTMRLKCTFLRKGDILVARMPEPLGRCCFFPLEGEGRFVTVVDVAIMRPHESFNAMWLMNLINSDYARRFIEDNAGGTTRKRISRKNLGGLLLPVPSISEQCRIAEILSDSDSFIAKQKKTVEQLSRTKRGLMDDLLTGKVRTV